MIVELTPKQVEEMKPLTDKVLSELKQGRHSCIVAQVMAKYDWDTMSPVPTMQVDFFDAQVTDRLQQAFLEAGRLSLENKIRSDMELDELQAYLTNNNQR